MSVQACEGVWLNRCGQRLYITEREPVRGQRWTDGLRIYSDDGSWHLNRQHTSEDLVEFVGPLPDKSQGDQTAEIDRLRADNNWLQAEVEGLLDNSREALRELQEDHTAMDHRAEGARLAFLDVIKTLLEMRR